MSKEEVKITAAPSEAGQAKKANKEKIASILALREAEKINVDQTVIALTEKKQPLVDKIGALNDKWIDIQRQLRETQAEYDKLDEQHEVVKRRQGQLDQDIAKLRKRLAEAETAPTT